MATIEGFVEALRVAFVQTEVSWESCQFHEASGQLVIAGETTRVVPVAALYARYVALVDDEARASLVAATTEAFVGGAADVPHDYDACGVRLLPQLWTLEKIAARQVTLPQGFELPHCGLHGESPPLLKKEHTLGVVLVCEYIAEESNKTGAMLPPIETPVLSSDLVRWGVSFADALRQALENLRSRTKAGPPAEKRWEHHASGCGQSCQRDRFDAARAALLPKLVAMRKRPDGVAEAGGHVVMFGTSSCVLATTSKNALGLCFMGDTLHLQIANEGGNAGTKQLLSATPYRLVKMKDSSLDKETMMHPLTQKAAEGFVWRWFPYSPGGPPLRAAGEFSVPIDQGEVDAILNAIEAGRPVPVFSHAAETAETAKSATSSQFATLKERGNALFKGGEYVKAIVAYDAALGAGAPGDSDAAVVHANAAQALLNLAAADEARRAPCAAEAMRRAMVAVELDPTNAKAHARCAAACEILGEPAAAAEAKAKADACLAADAATRAIKQAEAQKKRTAAEEQKAALERARQEREAREALLARERAYENEKDEADAAKERFEAASSLSAMLRGPSLQA
mmetsp:Transcript_101737/g.286885  ORF Transcript_101737/g.286885 Transcript_101737/m.286885 type:complete len:571 (-) Transcript_101737:110-1822(-)